jgi:hypothetical protein
MDFKVRFSSITDGGYAYKNGTGYILENTKLVKDNPRHKKETNAVKPNTGFIPPASLPVRNLCTLEV